MAPNPFPPRTAYVSVEMGYGLSCTALFCVVPEPLSALYLIGPDCSVVRLLIPTINVFQDLEV
jgi:hypothetical protein